jgi:hypothetical protein
MTTTVAVKPEVASVVGEADPSHLATSRSRFIVVIKRRRIRLNSERTNVVLWDSTVVHIQNV